MDACGVTTKAGGIATAGCIAVVGARGREKGGLPPCLTPRVRHARCRLYGVHGVWRGAIGTSLWSENGTGEYRRQSICRDVKEARQHTADISLNVDTSATQRHCARTAPRCRTPALRNVPRPSSPQLCASAGHASSLRMERWARTARHRMSAICCTWRVDRGATHRFPSLLYYSQATFLVEYEIYNDAEHPLSHEPTKKIDPNLPVLLACREHSAQTPFCRHHHFSSIYGRHHRVVCSIGALPRDTCLCALPERVDKAPLVMLQRNMLTYCILHIVCTLLHSLTPPPLLPRFADRAVDV